MMKDALKHYPHEKNNPRIDAFVLRESLEHLLQGMAAREFYSSLIVVN